MKKTTKRQPTWKDIERKLITGRPSARKLKTVDRRARKIITRYLPTVGGQWVKTGDGDRFETIAEARQAAKRFQAEYRKSRDLGKANAA